MVIVGIVIGGGMFVLFVDFVGVWFFWGVFIFIIVWFLMFYFGLLLLEVNLNYFVGFSFNIIIKDLIGNIWNIISGIIVVFVFYIFIYVYIFVNGVIISEMILMNLGYYVNLCIVGICIVIFVVSVLWISLLVVSCIILLFFGLKIIFFVIVFGFFFFQVDYFILCDVISIIVGMFYFLYIFMVLLVCLVLFGFYGNIFSLIICYGKCKDKLIKSVVFGLLLVLVIYFFWFYCMMGNILCESFKVIIFLGGNVDLLVKLFFGIKQYGIIEFCLLVFFNLVVVSLFFGVMLGLFDYLVDLFKIDNFYGGCFKIVLLIFLLFVLLYLIFLNGFIYGIGGVGLCVIIWVVIIFVVFVIKVCKKFFNQMFMVWGGNFILVIVIFFGIIVILCWFGNVFNVLFKFG